MRAQEYKTVSVTDLGSVQHAVAITKMTDGLRRRRRRRKYLRNCFSQRSQDEVVTQPNK
jgi:hypothetical protein